jgi:hypothetical protein
MTGDSTWSRAPVRRHSSRRYLAAAVLLDTVLTEVLLVYHTGGHLRSIVVFVFLMLGPGLAVTGFLRINDLAQEMVIAAPLSIVLGGIPAIMAFGGVWDIDVTLLCTTTPVAVTLVVQLVADAASGVAPASDAMGRPVVTDGVGNAARRADSTVDHVISRDWLVLLAATVALLLLAAGGLVLAMHGAG